MLDLAAKLIGHISATTSSRSAIFGGLGEAASAIINNNPATARPRFRVGLWPIKSASVPETGLGLGVLLAFLLEQRSAIVVYRLCTRVEGEPADYEWTPRQSQFDIDEWELDGLDENVAVWGQLDKDETLYRLKIEVENDTAEASDSLRQFEYEATTLAGIAERLPQIAQEICEYLGVDESRPLVPIYDTSAAVEDAALEKLMGELFRWELDLYLSLWGVPLLDQRLQDRRQSLVRAAKSCGEMGAWLAANAISRAISPPFDTVGDSLLPAVEEIADEFAEYPGTSVILALALFTANDALRAYELLENTVEAHAHFAPAWLALAELYWRGREVGASIDALQRGIQTEAAAGQLYLKYAERMSLLAANNIAMNFGARRQSVSGRTFVEELVLIDTDETGSEVLALEAIAAYRQTLSLEPDNIDALTQIILLSVDRQDPDVWGDFERLVTMDVSGDVVRTVVEAFYALEDISDGISILERLVAKFPERVTVRLNLASLYLLAEEPDKALEQLKQAREQNIDPGITSEIERLSLAAEDPDFDTRLGEISDLVDAGADLSGDDVEFLEAALEQAPSFAPGYTLLGAAYMKWGEVDDALDVLLDGQKQLPANPEISTLLATVLWESGEHDLAFDCLNKGLVRNPTHVPMLALTGRYLFEQGNDEAAKTFLLRAEALNPYDSTLNQVRLFIARNHEE